jgi:hypothetical protein
VVVTRDLGSNVNGGSSKGLHELINLLGSIVLSIIWHVVPLSA